VKQVVRSRKTTGATGKRPQAGRHFRALPHPVFRAIWIANLARTWAPMVQSVAAAWLMTELTDSNQLIALVQASATLPIMLFGRFRGRHRRQLRPAPRDAGRPDRHAADYPPLLAAMTMAGIITPIGLLAFTLTVGIGTALNSPAWQASVRQHRANERPAAGDRAQFDVLQYSRAASARRLAAC
jgi:hypothetical protein